MSDNIHDKINELRESALEALNSIKELKGLNEARVKFLGKKGPIQQLMRHMKDLSPEERPAFGQKVNELKQIISDRIEEMKVVIAEEELKLKIENERIDVSLPAYKLELGEIHPLTRVTEELEEFFISMGYEIKSGPEVESDLYTFEMLNLPKGHPARDMQDSFYVTEEYLLRTHTSPVQVRTMLDNKEKSPIRIICPGKVYRRDDDDATHSHQFMQLEGLVIDENISLANLKGTLEEFAKKMFGKDKKVRFRPSYFPFTEPSVEVDISCVKCSGKGCSMCKETGWIEVLGAGMVHPNVLEMSGYDSKKYSGFAFGMGIERIAMLKYGITDIRHFYTNDLRFLSQFKRVSGGNN